MLSFFKSALTDTLERAKARKAQRKFQRHEADKRINAKREREERAVRDAVWKRDHGVCRAYGVPVKRHSENPELWGHCAHVVSAAQGGSYTTDNMALLSPLAHDRNHLRRDGIGLEMTGDADGTLYFREFDLESGRTIQGWESHA